VVLDLVVRPDFVGLVVLIVFLSALYWVAWQR